MPHPIRVVRGYIADFSHAPRWDPATLHSAPTDDGPVRVGSGWTTWSALAGRTSTGRYRLDRRRPYRITLTGRHPGLTRTLEFTLVDLGEHTDVHLTIRYELCGLTAPARRWRQHHGLAELTEPAATALPAALGLELGERVPAPRAERDAPHPSGGLDLDL